MNVGFYYMANAGGRLAGTVLSGCSTSGRASTPASGPRRSSCSRPACSRSRCRRTRRVARPRPTRPGRRRRRRRVAGSALLGSQVGRASARARFGAGPIGVSFSSPRRDQLGATSTCPAWRSGAPTRANGLSDAARPGRGVRRPDALPRRLPRGPEQLVLGMDRAGDGHRPAVAIFVSTCRRRSAALSTCAPRTARRARSAPARHPGRAGARSHRRRASPLRHRFRRCRRGDRRLRRRRPAGDAGRLDDSRVGPQGRRRGRARHRARLRRRDLAFRRLLSSRGPGREPRRPARGRG